MADFESAGVISTERDYSATIALLGTSTGATVINSKWGYADYEMVCSNEDELVTQAGKPTDSNFRDWFTAAAFLKYTSKLRWVRAVDEQTALNAATGGTNPALLIKNPNDLQVVTSVKQLTQFFAAKCPGHDGNSIGIEIADHSTFDKWQYNSYFDTAPNTSGALANSNEEALDEVHVVIVDKLGYFTGTPNAVLETYQYLSKAKDAVDVNGASSYYVNKLNTASEYVFGLAPLSGDIVEDSADGKKSPIGARLKDGKPFVSLKSVYTAQLEGGNDGDVPGKNEYIEAFNVLVSPDETDISLIFAGGCGNDLNQTEISSFIIEEATRRGDMLAYVSPKFSDVVGVQKTAVVKNILATKEALSLKNSYGTMSSGYKLTYDKYNDTNRWIPCNGDDAGLAARTENEYDVWLSPAGFNRGQYVSCIALAFNPDKTARDTLYKNNINPISTFPKDGTILYGDKTLQAKNSAFTWIGIRRLFIYLRKSIQSSAKYNLFEFNTQFSRQAFKDKVEPILREIKGKEGIFDFYVRCDETNNTSDVISRGEFVAEIIIKPQYSIQGIRLAFTAVRRDVSFDEAVFTA